MNDDPQHERPIDELPLAEAMRASVDPPADLPRRIYEATAPHLPFDARLDAQLTEAMRAAPHGDLRDKLYAATVDSLPADPAHAELDAELSGALSANGPSPDLNERLYVATAHHLPTDATLESELSEAMHGAAPEGLNDRLHACTAAMLPWPGGRKRVIGRIGFERLAWRAAIAAAWLFAVGGVLWLRSLAPDGLHEQAQFIAVVQDIRELKTETRAPAPVVIEELDTEWLTLSLELEETTLAIQDDHFEGPTGDSAEWVNQEIELLALELDAF